MKVKAFAKINLTLDVPAKRPDGYHELKSIMQSISLCDELEINKTAGDITLVCDDKSIPTDEKNTAFKAAKLFLEHIRVSSGVSISISKRIPSQAGLGGGSADAAAVLLALNELFEAGLSEAGLSGIGAMVGADVPFCLHGGTALCTGIGDIVAPAPSLPECFIVVCKPPVGMSTPEAYREIDSLPPAEKIYSDEMLNALKSGDLPAICRALNNRFEDVVKLPEVPAIKSKMLSGGALGALMTGSGTAVYGIYENKNAALLSHGALKDMGEVFLAVAKHKK